jgi:glucose-6-phosphate 1-dehydrogenase
LVGEGGSGTSAKIIGYARSELTDDDFIKRITPGKFTSKKVEDQWAAFVKLCSYKSGGYDDQKSFEELSTMLDGADRKSDKEERIFYLALPPTMFYRVAKSLRQYVYTDDADILQRLVIEKPFGRDSESSDKLSQQIGALWREDQVYRIDHYLGKEMVKNIMVLRFANMLFVPIFSRAYISNVQITFKESFGTEGRGGYFDEYGIIRDVVQNHLLQVLSILAMERPVSLSPEDIRDEKVKVLRCIKPVDVSNLMVGQYVKSEDGKKPGYLDDETVPKNSKTPTYAAMALFIDNDRWSGVPFIMKAGKALDENKTEIRVQFRDVPGGLFPSVSRNELVIRVQPNEAVYIKMMNKKPGLDMDTVISELDLSYKTRFQDERIPDAYESLLLDILRGDKSNFVRNDELKAAWKIFTPILHHLESLSADQQLDTYQYGSRGPAGISKFLNRFGFIRHKQEYVWSPNKL